MGLWVFVRVRRGPGTASDELTNFRARKGPLNRYNVSQRNKFTTNPDGSTDIYIQADSPGKAKESNWLPAPKDDFVLMMRLYWPKEKDPTILNGSWKIPGVKKVS